MATYVPTLPYETPILTEQTEGNGLDKSGTFTFLESAVQIISQSEAAASGQGISPEVLYKVYQPVELESETPSTLKVIEKISYSLAFLEQALEADDELERESIMISFSESIFELTFFPTKSKELKDAIFLVHTVIEAHKKEPYDTDKILTLMKVMNLIKNNPYMGDETLDQCSELLEAAGFDVNAPIGELEL